MDGEHRGEEPRPRHGQPPGKAPEKQRIGEVQRDVDRVVAGRREPPQLVLQPEGRIDQRPVVPLFLDGAGRKPDPPQTGDVADRGVPGEDFVVPDETGEEGGEVAGGHQQAEGHGGQDAAPRGSAASGRGRRRVRRRRLPPPRLSCLPFPARPSHATRRLDEIGRPNPATRRRPSARRGRRPGSPGPGPAGRDGSARRCSCRGRGSSKGSAAGRRRGRVSCRPT